MVNLADLVSTAGAEESKWPLRLLIPRVGLNNTASPRVGTDIADLKHTCLQAERAQHKPLILIRMFCYDWWIPKCFPGSEQ